MTKITLKAIQKEIATFTTNRDKLRDQAHVIAMMIFYHAAPKEVGSDCNGTGDCTQAAYLMDALPKSWAAQMRVWFNANTPIRVAGDNKNAGYDKKYLKLSAEEKLLWWKLEEANTVPFHAIVEESEPTVQLLDTDDIVRMTKQLAKRLQDKLNEDEIKPDAIPSAQALIALMASIGTTRIELPANVNAPKKSEQEVEADRVNGQLESEAA